MTSRELYSRKEYQEDDSFLQRVGKLDQDWKNVRGHNTTEKIAVLVVGNWLGLDPVEIDSLARSVGSHDIAKKSDVYKRLIRKGKKPDFSFTKLEELILLEQVYDELMADPGYHRAAGEHFLYKHFIQQRSVFFERLLFYLDDLTMGDEIVPFIQRINEVEGRDNGKLNNDIELTTRLGGRYWDRERELCATAQDEIYEKLTQAGFPIETADNFPHLLKAEVDNIKAKIGYNQ